MLTPELITFLLLCHDIHQIVVHEARMRIVVLGVHETETVLLVERDCIQVGINSQETATSLIFNNKHGLDDIQQSRSKPSPLRVRSNP